MHKIIVEHRIQREILVRLASSQGLRFSELKPQGLESNIFMYHLTALRKLGLLEKSATTYQLTSAGLTYVDQLSFSTLRPRLQPKVICVVVVRNARGEIVMLQRQTQPFIGHLMLPSGKLHFGESLAAHANRELQEKTGLQTSLQQRGVAHITTTLDGIVVTQALAHIWSGVVEDDAMVTCSDPRFTCTWVSETNAPTHKLWVGTAEIIAMLDQKQELFIAEFNF